MVQPLASGMPSTTVLGMVGIITMCSDIWYPTKAQYCEGIVLSSYSWLTVPTISYVPMCKRCSVPVFDVCRYNFSTCDGLQAGESCEIGCLAPFTGSPTVANCSGGEGTPSERLSWTLPDCACPHPDPDPENGYYWEESTRRWKCMDGYAGDAQVRCRAALDCSSVQSYLTGCERITHCAVPLVDHCRFDVSSCSGLLGGRSCEMRCKPPFIGVSTIATCPLHNTDPSQLLSWPPMVCVPENCSDPFELPEGYAYSTDGVLECAEGYVGKAERTCVPGNNWLDTCNPIADLSGCVKMSVCDPPNLQVPPKIDLMDTCYYDFSSCQSLPPGAICSVFCKSPYRGWPTNASCPADNTHRNGMVWSLPECSASRCGEPVGDIPEGYELVGTEWECEAGYTGSPLIKCLPEAPPKCGAVPVLTGCHKIFPCEMQQDHCRYDFSECQSVPAGLTCNVGCKAPFLGIKTVAYCDQYNDDRANGLRWTPPACTLGSCVDPPQTPPGYSKNGSTWVCAIGYVGTVVKDCVFNEETCMEDAYLSGCVEEQPCRAPDLNAEDSCKLDFSECLSLPAGRSCMVRCKDPWAGSPTYAFCPAGNIDPTQEMHWTPPFCDCPDLAEAPAGYNVLSNETGRGSENWECAMGYVGTVTKVCQPASLLSGWCAPFLEPGVVTGCGTPLPCQVSRFMDAGSSRHSGLSGTVEFGQASVNGDVLEDNVFGYRLVFADACGTLLSTDGDKMQLEMPSAFNLTNGTVTLASPSFVRRRDKYLNFTCCSSSAYSIELNAVQVPAGATQMLIVVNTGSAGELEADAKSAARVPFEPGSIADGILRGGFGTAQSKAASSLAAQVRPFLASRSCAAVGIAMLLVSSVR